MIRLEQKNPPGIRNHFTDDNAQLEGAAPDKRAGLRRALIDKAERQRASWYAYDSQTQLVIVEITRDSRGKTTRRVL